MEKEISGWTPEEGWFILTNLDRLEAAIKLKKRFGIEQMFRDFKSGGYNLESTNVRSAVAALILIITLAYTAATIQGEKNPTNGRTKYIRRRVKESNRSTRRHSSFYIGLYSQSWVNFVEPCRELVSQ